MKITEIIESGSNNVLLWAIKNNADIKSDLPLQEMINSELFYLVTVEGVNLFELFRLTQTFRNKLRILNEYSASVPDSKALVESFPGSFTDADDQSKRIPTHSAVEHAANNFINIALQMHQDSDIISPSVVRMYIPMIARRFDIQIPIAFIDVIDSIRSTEYAAKLFSEEYPNTLQTIIENPANDVYHMIQIVMMKLTTIIKLNPRQEKYIKYIKYSAFDKLSNSKLYKLYMLGFRKFNPIGCNVVHCSLFNIDTNTVPKTLKTLSRINSPLELDFAIQLPIELMQTLQNVFGPDMLTISCESSMLSILNEGLAFNDFVAPEIESEDSEVIKERSNAISAYKVRLTEANQYALNVIKLATEDQDNDVTAAFSLLPSMYMTNAVITVKLDDINKMSSKVTDLNLIEIFNHMSEIGNNVINDIESSSK